MGVAIGVDSHKSSLAVGVLDDMGRTVGVREFPNDRGGHDSLIDWVDHHGPARVIGIEGSGSYGAALAQQLLQAGEDVREVPAFMSHRERKKNPSRASQMSMTRLRSLRWWLAVRASRHLTGRRCTRISSSSATTVTSSFALGRD